MRLDFRETAAPPAEASPSADSPRIITVDHEASHAASAAQRQLGVLLPFTVKLVRTEAQLAKAVKVRADAFLRHAPQLGRQLLEPEAADRAPGNVVLLAESKETGEPEGSIRIETNFDSLTEFEALLPLPEQFEGKTLAQVSRLGIRTGPGGTLIKQALFKALYRFCLATQIDFMMVAARTPQDAQAVRVRRRGRRAPLAAIGASFVPLHDQRVPPGHRNLLVGARHVEQTPPGPRLGQSARPDRRRPARLRPAAGLKPYGPPRRPLPAATPLDNERSPLIGRSPVLASNTT